MKAKIIYFFLFSLISHIGLAQINVNDLKQINNVPQYQDGEQALERHFFKSLRYPMEFIRNPIVCTILGFIKVSKNGKIEEIGTLNKVPKPFKNTFIEAAKLTDGQWAPTNESADFFYVVIPIEFSYEGVNYTTNFNNKPKSFCKALKVKTFSPTNSYKDDSKYLEKIDEFISKEKYQKAVETIEFLLSRQPLNMDYYKKIIELNTRLGKKEETAYYTALLDTISTTN